MFCPKHKEFEGTGVATENACSVLNTRNLRVPKSFGSYPKHVFCPKHKEFVPPAIMPKALSVGTETFSVATEMPSPIAGTDFGRYPPFGYLKF